MIITMFDICKFYPIWLPWSFDGIDIDIKRQIDEYFELLENLVLYGSGGEEPHGILDDKSGHGCVLPQEVIECSLLEPTSSKGITAKQSVKLGQLAMEGLQKGLEQQ